MPRRFLSTLVLLVGFSTTDAQPPSTPKRPVTDSYHGNAVVDDFRWLEDWKDVQVQQWSEAQNAHARRVLQALPGRTQLHARLKQILGATTTSHGDVVVRPDRCFALRRQPPKQQPFLVVLPALDKPADARVLVDPNVIDPQGHTTIDWFVPSPDGRLVAVSLSKGGSESGDVHLFDVATGNRVDVVIPRVQGGTAGGSLAWDADGKGFFYTRYPRGNERPAADQDFYQQVYHHAMGATPEEDRYELGKDFPRVAEVRLELCTANGSVLASVQDGDSGVFAHFLRPRSGSWTRIADFKDSLIQGTFSPAGDLFFVSRQDAPRGKILRLSAAHPDLKAAEVVIPEGTDTIVTDFYGPPGQATVMATATRLYVTYQLGGPSAIRAFGHDGRPAAAPNQPPVAAIRGLIPLGDDDLLFMAGSFTEPASYRRYRSWENLTVRVPLSSEALVDLSDVTVVREFARSKDGTQVPVNILVPRGVARDGTAPCLATGYGGFNVNIEPGFNPAWRVLFDHGFVVAVANLRGGGEFGQAWHTAGNLVHKQNVFDDFAAVLGHLVERKYTTKDRLAIEGGSNGGLLMGATLTQHPDLMKCVVSHVGIYDMLRVELSSNGSFNIPEFGTVKDEGQFRALKAYSPYHHVRDGTKYPATLFLTGANDPRVDPMQSRKMTARLQAASPGSTVLLRTTSSAGHGMGTALSERIDELTDVYAFLFAQLSVSPNPQK